MKKITTYEEFQEVKNKDKSLIKLEASWCQPCKQLDTQLSQIESFEVYKVSVEDLPEVAGELGIMGVPYTFIFKGGEKAGEFKGVKTKEEIEEMYNNL